MGCGHGKVPGRLERTQRRGVLRGLSSGWHAACLRRPRSGRLALGPGDRPGSRQARGHTNYIYSLAFSPDGTRLVSGSGDGTVRIWDTEPPALRQQARREAEALRPEAERLVEKLFRENSDATEVAAAIRADRSLRASPAESGLTRRDEKVRTKRRTRKSLRQTQYCAARRIGDSAHAEHHRENLVRPFLTDLGGCVLYGI